MPALIPTCDPWIFIEERRDGYVRYVSTSTMKRWEVLGTCDNCGACLVGAHINGEKIMDLTRAAELASAYAGPDCPVGPGWDDCPNHQLTIANVEDVV